MSETCDFPVTERTRAHRRPQRVAYDEAAVYAILDASLLAHIGYLVDGEPFVTPTTFWREGRHLYWHGAAASRAIASAAGARVCVTVSQLDGLILARSGFGHSAMYRSVMAFGRAEIVTDREAKRAAMGRYIDRLYPGRWATLRPALDAEIDALTVVVMEIEEASAKVRDDQVAVLPADQGWPAFAGVLPVRQVVGELVPDTPSPATSPDLAAFAAGARFDQALAQASAASSIR